MSPGIEVGGAIDVGIPIDGGIPIGGITFGIGGPTKREKFSIISYIQYAIACNANMHYLVVEAAAGRSLTEVPREGRSCSVPESPSST